MRTDYLEKVQLNLPAETELLREGTSEKGASRRGAAFGRFPRKICVFWAFLRKLRKTPSPAT